MLYTFSLFDQDDLWYVKNWHYIICLMSTYYVTPIIINVPAMLTNMYNRRTLIIIIMGVKIQCIKKRFQPNAKKKKRQLLQLWNKYVWKLGMPARCHTNVHVFVVFELCVSCWNLPVFYKSAYKFQWQYSLRIRIMHKINILYWHRYCNFLTKNKQKI